MGHGSLLALDALASEESIRVALYGRAMEMHKRMSNPIKVELIAEAFVRFVKNERYKLDALDIALRFAGRRTPVETLIAQATEIVRWAKPPVAAQPQPQTSDPVVVRKKKIGARKK